jgi:LmbE family N-acetylglucosaminyl deacetylase
MSTIESTEAAEAPVPKKRIAAIMAHPDDPDFSCAGTCARWAAAGHEVYYVIITNGDKGSDDRTIPGEQLMETREREQRQAGEILGLKDVIFMRKPDGMLVPDLALRKDLVRVIRTLKPNVIICQDPTSWYFGQEYINHPDHRAAGQVTLEAIFPAARNHRMFPELMTEEGLEPHRVDEVYVSSPKEPDTWIDISTTMDQKISALRAHVSQLGDWDPDEPIRNWAREDGKRADPSCEYAEDFRYFKLD